MWWLLISVICLAIACLNLFAYAFASLVIIRPVLRRSGRGFWVGIVRLRKRDLIEFSSHSKGRHTDLIVALVKWYDAILLASSLAAVLAFWRFAMETDEASRDAVERTPVISTDHRTNSSGTPTHSSGEKSPCLLEALKWEPIR